MKKILIMDPLDNVGIALEDIRKGDLCADENKYIYAVEDIAFCHKIALRDLEKGEEVLKYGQKIGAAVIPIRQGEWVHRHNIASERGR